MHANMNPCKKNTEATNSHRKVRLEFVCVVTCASDAVNDCFHRNKKVVFI